jgi:hypothetical protein
MFEIATRQLYVSTQVRSHDPVRLCNVCRRNYGRAPRVVILSLQEVCELCKFTLWEAYEN